MTDAPRPVRGRRRTRLWIALGVLLVVVGLLSWRFWPVPSDSIAAADGAAIGAEATTPLDLPENARVLIFGDSWTWGSVPGPGKGYAYLVADLMDWTTIVNGVRGSGYLKPGLDGDNFATRIAYLDPWLAPDLVILQGSINDGSLYPNGYAYAVRTAWDRLESIYPEATIVILGPAPQVLPVQESTAAMDADLAQFAAARGWWYISPVGEEWITDANYLDVIDTSAKGKDHPSEAGHRYLAQRLAAAIRAISR